MVQWRAEWQALKEQWKNEAALEQAMQRERGFSLLETLLATSLWVMLLWMVVPLVTRLYDIHRAFEDSVELERTAMVLASFLQKTSRCFGVCSLIARRLPKNPDTPGRLRAEVKFF